MTSSFESNIQVGKKYQIQKKIGSGSFGDIYLGINMNNDDEEEVAIKMEPIKNNHAQLAREAKIYKSLHGIVGIPSIKYYGTEEDYNVLVLSLLGKSLQDLFEDCGGRFNLKTVLMLTDQILCRLEVLHSRGILHRDIKPDNFLMGRGPTKFLVHLIDFGLAKLFRDPSSKKHIPHQNGKSLVGTARYASINAHMGVEQSRRDDLESVGYILVYFLRGSLPWQGIKCADKRQKNDMILQRKNDTSTESLCNGLPAAFRVYFEHVRSLGFEDRPDYEYLRRLFRELFMRKGYSYDCQFDWLPLVTPVSATGTSSTIEKSFTSGDTETTSTTCGTKHNNTRDDDDDEDGDEDDG